MQFARSHIQIHLFYDPCKNYKYLVKYFHCFQLLLIGMRIDDINSRNIKLAIASNAHISI